MYKYKYKDFYSASISQQYWDSMALCCNKNDVVLLKKLIQMGLYY